MGSGAVGEGKGAIAPKPQICQLLRYRTTEDTKHPSVSTLFLLSSMTSAFVDGVAALAEA